MADKRYRIPMSGPPRVLVFFRPHGWAVGSKKSQDDRVGHLVASLDTGIFRNLKLYRKIYRKSDYVRKC